MVTITDGTSGAVLYCTTDGTAPTTSSPPCSQPTTVFKSEFLQALAVAPGKSPSAIASAGYTINLAAAATPTFSPAGGSYTASETVTLASATAGANIFYTTDGSAPTASSTLYVGPLTVTQGETISAIAVASGFGDSGVASATYTINAITAAPTFSPAGGTYLTPQMVAIGDQTAGATIYYTDDGSIPSSSSNLYTGPVLVTTSHVINAFAVAPGLLDSPVSGAAYLITPPAATPTFTPQAGAYTAIQTVLINDQTPGSAIYYTIDGSTPSTSSTLYAGPVQVATSETLSAIAVAPGFTSSAAAQASYTISLATAPPVISPPGGTYTTAQTVAIADTAPAAVIYYTTDGSSPTTSSTLYTGPFQVAASETISAIATSPGSANSAVAQASYTISLAVAVPTYSPVPGTYKTAQKVTISETTSGSTIYYTTDGSTPSTGSTVYSGPVTVTKTETIKAVASGKLGTSPIATAVYTISSLSPAAAPTLTPPAGTYSAPQNVTISSTTPGDTIYYTLDGTTPTTASTRYSGPVPVAAAETISAIATASGFSASAVSAAAYTIATGNAAIQGKVLSGNLPVKAAQVQLYAAGQSGYGSMAKILLTSPVVSDDQGAFSFGYNCPASPGDLVYLIARGGDTGSGANASRVLMLALGSCSKVTAATKIVINEVTTIASAYALSAFMTSAPDVGSSSTNYVGLTNAFATAANLVDGGTGVARSITPAYAASPVAYLNSSTVPQARINTLANLLNGCAGSSAGGCANLFSNATPPAGKAPGDTLQVAADIAANPGLNVAALFGLASPAGPFQPVLTGAPGDWTLALTFTGGGLGIQPGTSAAPVVNTSLAIDATGNIWVAGSAQSTGGATNLYAEFNNLGAPLTRSTTVTGGASPVATYGGVEPSLNTGSPNALAFDPSGNLWIGAQSTKVQNSSDGLALAEINSSNVLQSGLSTGNDALSLAIDGAGKVWLGEVSSPIDEYDNSGNRISPAGGFAAISTIGQLGDTHLIFDAKGNLWGESNDGFGDLNLISQVDGSILFDPFFLPGGVYSPIAADGAGEVYGCGAIDSASGAGGQALNVFDAASMALMNTFPIATGRGCGGHLAVDGLGRIFAVTGNFAPGIVDEFTTAGISISPAATGYTGTSAGEAIAINPDPAQSIPVQTMSAPVPGSGLAGAAIDGSGNLWVLNSDTGISPSLGNVLVEFVGLAAPLVTPASLGLENKTLGLRP